MNNTPDTSSPRNKQAIFTISDADYAVMALTMFDSVSQFYKDTDLFLFVIGTGSVDRLEGNINIVYIGDVLDDLDLSQRLAHYLQVEISTSIRPQCFQFLFARSYDRAIYLDPDIYVFRRMTEVDDLLNGEVNGIVTPHALQSVSPVNAIGGDNVFLQCGIFNLGFLALKNTPETKRLLSWWGEKLKWKCIVDWPNGYFVDQKWLEFLPVYFDAFHILKLPTYNLAPWNSEHYRILTGANGTFFINDFDTPIAFIHYSGVKRAELHFMHMKEAYLFYMKQLEKRRFLKLDFQNYDLRFKQNNLYFDKVCTFLYKDYVNLTKDTKSNPLVDRGFYEYLNSIDSETQLPVYIRKLYEILPDIFVGYLSTKQAINYDNLVALMKVHFSYDGVASLETMVQLRNDRTSTNFDVRHEHSKPTVTSQQNTAVAKVELSHRPAVLSFCGSRRRHARDDDTSDQQVIFNSDRIEIVSGSIRVGIPLINESGALPANFEVEAQNYTEIWVPSAHCKEQLCKTHGLSNLTPIPYSVSKPRFEIKATGLPNDRFIVMLRHDFDVDFTAQNPLASIRAFKKAFGHNGDVLLVCYLTNVKQTKDYETLIEIFASENNAITVESSSDDSLYFSYLHHAHCFISLHRDTAFGAALAEAMSLGKYVIATKSGGNTDYMNSDNSFLVDSALSMGVEAEAAKILTVIYNDGNLLNTKGKRAKLSIQKHLSPHSVGFIMQKRIDELHGLARRKFIESNMSLFSRALRKLDALLKPSLRKYPIFLGTYSKFKRRGRDVVLGENHQQIETVVKILLKNVNRPAILE